MSSIKETELEIGQIIELDGNRYQIIGTDLTSDQHPVGGRYFNWDYLLKRTDNGELKRVTKEELKNSVVITTEGVIG